MAKKIKSYFMKTLKNSNISRFIKLMYINEEAIEDTTKPNHLELKRYIENYKHDLI